MADGVVENGILKSAAGSNDDGPYLVECIRNWSLVDLGSGRGVEKTANTFPFASRLPTCRNVLREVAATTPSDGWLCRVWQFGTGPRPTVHSKDHGVSLLSACGGPLSSPRTVGASAAIVVLVSGGSVSRLRRLRHDL
jgi:hypothetical protein